MSKSSQVNLSVVRFIARFAALAVASFALGACDIAPGQIAQPAPQSRPPLASPDTVPDISDPRIARLASVVARSSPVAQQTCRERALQLDCRFVTLIDDRPGQPANAFHTRDRDGRPLIIFTLALLEMARNGDELALIYGHEAGHHIADHLPRMREQAMSGAALGGLLAQLTGADAMTSQRLSELGATVGARRYSKAFELEADAIGTVIAARAGYDPIAGARFFSRIPDPGNVFLGTHPPHPERIAVIEATMRDLRAGRPI